MTKDKLIPIWSEAIISELLVFKILNNKKITILNSTHNYEDFDYDLHLRILYRGNNREITKIK